MKLSEIIAQYDVPEKKFYIGEFAGQINKCDESEQISLEFQAERLAFNLEGCYEQDEKSGKMIFSFRPLISFKDQEGIVHVSADIDKITPDIISYWERRIYKTKNSILKAQYAGLVWKFKDKVCGMKRDIKIAHTYIESLNDAIKKDLFPHFAYGIKNAERAIQLSKSLNLEDLLQQSKEVLNLIIDRDTENPDTEKNIGIWAAPFRISLQHPGTYTQAEQEQLVSALQTRFDKNSDESCPDPDPWLLRELADVLSEYYTKNKGMQNKIPDLYRRVKASFDRVSKNLTKLQMVANLKQLYPRYLRYLPKAECDTLMQQINETAKGIQAEMHTLHEDISFSKEEMQSYVDSILQDDIEQTFGAFTSKFIPQQEQNKKRFIEISEINPFAFIFPQMIFDEKGRVTSTVGSLEKDMDGNLVVFISCKLKIDTILLSATIEEGKRRKLFTVANILDFLHKSPSIPTSRFPIIERGLEAYFNGDHITSIHLLIPQIEAAISNILDLCGIPIHKLNLKTNAFQLRLLDELLRDEQVQKCLTNDYAYYLRILLTDNRGWNLRNDVCHGIAEPDIFNCITADRILHALLCLGAFRRIK